MQKSKKKHEKSYKIHTKCIQNALKCIKYIKIHKNTKMKMHFLVLRQSFCRKFKMSAGSGSQASQLLECMIWRNVNIGKHLEEDNLKGV